MALKSDATMSAVSSRKVSILTTMDDQVCQLLFRFATIRLGVCGSGLDFKQRMVAS